MSEQFLRVGNEELRLQGIGTLLYRVVEEDRRVRQDMADLEDFWYAGRKKPYNRDPLPFAGYWNQLLEEVNPSEKLYLETFLVRLYGQIVLDIGCGEDTSDVQGLLAPYQPAGYIGIDKQVNFTRPELVKEDEKRRWAIQPLSTELGDMYNGYLIQGDVLEIIVQLPEDSFSPIINAIDVDIIDTETPYGREVTYQIHNILHPDGIAFGYTTKAGVLTRLSQFAGAESAFLSRMPAAGGEEDGFYFIQKTGVR
jgi:hypothetical protein